VAWVIEINPWWAGIAIIVLLSWLRRKEQAEWTQDLVVSLGSYAPSAVCLVGVCLGRGLWLFGGLPNSTDGWHIAAGMLGAAWTIMGVNKLKESGLRWMGPRNMALMVAERSHVGSATGRRLRRWLMNSLKPLLILGIVGLLGELGGVLFCVPEFRPAYAGFVVVFMFVNWLLLGFAEHEWALVWVAVAMAG
jgi:hypothetical protein